MTVTVNHAKTNAISDWTQAQLDEQIALGNFAPGTTLANIVLPSDWNDDHTLTGLGTMAEQNANNVAITGGSVNGTTIGATTASTGTFTTLIGGANVANYGQLTGGATTKAVEFVALGTDSNISIALDSKGTGAIDLAAGSSGVNISNGGTVTAITRTATGSGYTTKPTCTVSAPTTAGGVQAVVDFPMAVSGVTVASGGTGYTVGNVLSIVGGTLATGSAATITVATVSSGVITSVTLTTAGVYSTLPTNPVSVTGGSGSSATFNLTWLVSAGVAFTITNAGSGYIEQPTVSFSGGGGSGASAFANVGGTVRVTAISSVMELATSSGVGFRVANSGTTNVNFLSAQGNSTGGTAAIYGIGADTDVSVGMGAKAAGSVRFFTNTSTEQMRVSNTTSAVNYVQVTGNTTSNNPTISAQGSDTNPSLWLTAKGAGQVVSRSWFTAAQASSNYWQMAGASAGSSPVLSVLGSDTNINLTLTPKGTGRVQFGTYTGTILTPTGYVEILDSGGTVRRLLVG